MNEEIIKTEEVGNEYLDKLEFIPEEVRRFMWSDAFSVILNSIVETYKINDNQKNVVEKVVLEILINGSTPISIRSQLSDSGIVGENQKNILSTIDQEIISRAVTQIENYKDEETLYQDNQNLDQETPVSINTEIQAPSPLQALNSIQERLTKPNTVAPITTRDYSVTKSEPAALQTDMSPKPKIMDIYRELPEQ